MRRILTAAAGLVLLATSASAQIPVIDAASVLKLGQQLVSMGQQLDIQTQSLAQLQQLLTTGVNTLSQLKQLYTLTQTVESDLAHLTNANSLAVELNELRNSMSPTAIMPTALTGAGHFGTDADGWATQFHDANIVYEPSEGGATDWVAQRMSRDAWWLANAQGQGAKNLVTLEGRVPSLADLQNCVDNSATLQDEQACNSRIATENAYAINQSAQATNLLVLTNAQRDAAEQAQQQENRYQLDQASQALCNTSAGLGTKYVSTLCMEIQGGGGGGEGVGAVAAAGD